MIENFEWENINLKNEKIISVIIPVYNVEKYISRCIDSVLAQTYNSLEIILVDDGSTDNSGNICDEYAKRDERIKVIHKCNGGLSSARNEGMKYASGELVAFVDSDDYIEPTMYQTMMNYLIKSQADMAICNICFVDEEGTEVAGFEHINMFGVNSYLVVEKEEIMKQLTEKDLLTVVQWNKLFYREKIMNCQYPEGRYHEDVYVIHKQLFNCDRIIYINDKFYNYVQRNNSIMHMETNKMIEDAIEGYEDRINFFEQKKLIEAKGKAIECLLNYIKWKVEIQCRNQVPFDHIWLIKKFKDEIDKWNCISECDEECLLLYNRPLKYYKNIIRKNRVSMSKKRVFDFLNKLRNI